MVVSVQQGCENSKLTLVDVTGNTIGAGFVAENGNGASEVPGKR